MFCRAHWFLVILSISAGAAWATASTPSIWPLGDSITYGYGTGASPNSVPGGYRDPLYVDLTNAGKAFTYVGTSNLNPSATLTAAGETAHDGHSGYTIDQVNNNLSGDDTSGVNSTPGSDNDGGFWLSGGGGTGRAALSPSIILLHIGTNDATEGRSAAQMELDLTSLLNNLKGARPNAQIFVASLIPRTDSSSDESVQKTYSAAIPAILTAEGSNFHFVDMHSAFENSGEPLSSLLQSDGVHASQAGYDLMATTWFNSVESYVPEPASFSMLIIAGTTLLRRARRR